MIKIDFVEHNTTEWRSWVEKCSKKQRTHNVAIEAGRDSKIDEKLYKGQKEEVYINKTGPFRGKCAYCESDIYKSQYGDVEHFRPKNAVENESGKPIKINIRGKKKLHPGYYWLAYDWRNLLPACELCNRTNPKLRTGGKLIGKGKRFPVRHNNYATMPGDEASEDPLLINPIWTDPSAHLEIDETGVLSHKDDVGYMCIEIFGLNDRGLPDARKKTYETVKKKYRLFVMAILMSGHERLSLKSELREIEDGFEEHTIAARKAIENAKAELRAEFQHELGL